MNSDSTLVLAEHARIQGTIPELFLRADLVAAALGAPGYDAEARQRFARRLRSAAGRLRPGEPPGAQDDVGLRALYDDILGWRDCLIDGGDEDVGELGVVPAGKALIDSAGNADVTSATLPERTLVLRAPWRADLDRKHPDVRFNVSWTDVFERVLAQRGLGWGIVTSGNVLRVVRRGTAARASYLEFDVLAIVDDLEASDATIRRSAQTAFDLVVLFARAGAFTPKPRGKKGTLTDHAYLAALADEDERQVGKDLADQVYPALEWILRGLLEHPENRGADGRPALLRCPGDPSDMPLHPSGIDLRAAMDPLRYDEDALRELDRQGLIFLYRLLFLFMADARGLTPQHSVYLRSYSARAIARDAIRAWDGLARAEQEAERVRVRTWYALGATFRLARTGASLPDRTVFPALNGSLFDAQTAPLLEHAFIGEGHLIEALRRLTRRQIRRRGSERGKWIPIEFARLDIERLGSVYEGLLDFDPRVAAQPMVELRTRVDETIVVTLRDAPRVLAGLEAAAEAPAPARQIGEEETDEPPEEIEEEEATEERDEPVLLRDEVLEEECPAAIRGHQRFARFVPAGRFYLSPASARRKGSGSYYTPVELTTYLVRDTLAPLVAGKRPEEILRLRVVDPAMGSGAFLVAACRFLGEAYTRVAVEAGEVLESEITDEMRAQHRRVIAEHCLFGVDLNPMAVELAKVSLWLETLAKDRPLTFLDHRLRAGNSLIGARVRDLDGIPDEVFDMLPRSATKEQKAQARVLKKQNGNERVKLVAQLGLPGFGSGAELVQPIDLLRQGLAALAGPSDTVADVRRKAQRYGELRRSAVFEHMRRTMDLWCAAWFWSPDSQVPRPTSATFRRLVNQIWGREADTETTDHAILSHAEEIAAHRRFFHWELEFPEAAPAPTGDAVSVAGFDAVIGNPPWDKIEAHPNDFFPMYDPLYRTYDSGGSRAAEERLCMQFEVRSRWQYLKDEADLLSAWTRSAPGYMHQIGGRAPNIYRAFAERAVRLLRSRGRLGFVLPGNLCAEDAGVGIRRLWLTENRWVSARVFENRERIFPIHRSLKFGAFVVEAGGGDRCARRSLHATPLLPTRRPRRGASRPNA